MDWQTIELLGYTFYSEMGFRILAPLVRNDGYDFVAEKDGEFLRVNVKTAGLKDKSQLNSWCIAHASGGYSNNKDRTRADVYLTWLPQSQKFIEIQGDFLVGGNSKSRRIPKELLI